MRTRHGWKQAWLVLASILAAAALSACGGKAEVLSFPGPTPTLTGLPGPTVTPTFGDDDL